MRVLIQFAVAAFCLVGVVSTSPAGDDPFGEQLRLYDAGLLTVADFQATVPRSTSFFAYTETDVRYEFRYRSLTRGNVATVTLTEFKVYAIVERDKSWNLRPDDKELLDHEQGHFDLAQLYALQVRLEFTKMLKDNAALTTTAATERDAAKALAGKIEDLVQPFIDRMNDAHSAYDRITRHGNLPSEQADERKKHRAALKALAEKLRELDDA